MKIDVYSEKEKKILNLETRKKIYEAVKKFAGSHFREIERKSDLPSGTVRHHLSYLRKQGLIDEEKDGKNVRYFPKEFKSENKKLIGLLRQNSIRKILVYILMNKKCGHEDIVGFVKLSPSTVSWHLKKLAEAGVILFLKKGKRTTYDITVDRGEVIKLLITYKESFFDALVDNVIEMWESQ